MESTDLGYETAIATRPTALGEAEAPDGSGRPSARHGRSPGRPSRGSGNRAPSATFRFARTGGGAPLAEGAAVDGGGGRIGAGGYYLAPTVKTMLDTVTTDDAYVNGHVTLVAARVPGQVIEVLVDDNYRCQEGGRARAARQGALPGPGQSEAGDPGHDQGRSDVPRPRSGHGGPARSIASSSSTPSRTSTIRSPSCGRTWPAWTKRPGQAGPGPEAGLKEVMKTPGATTPQDLDLRRRIIWSPRPRSSRPRGSQSGRGWACRPRHRRSQVGPHGARRDARRPGPDLFQRSPGGGGLAAIGGRARRLPQLVRSLAQANPGRFSSAIRKAMSIASTPKSSRTPRPSNKRRPASPRPSAISIWPS